MKLVCHKFVNKESGGSSGNKYDPPISRRGGRLNNQRSRIPGDPKKKGTLAKVNNFFNI